MTNSEQERQLEVAYEAEELLRTLDLRCVEPTRFLFDAWRAGRDHLGRVSHISGAARGSLVG